MKIHIICLNDKIKAAVLEGHSKAEEKLKDLALSYYEFNKHLFNGYEQYKSACHWHIRTLDADE